MKRLLMLFVCALFAITAHAQSEHLTFKGVPIDGTLSQYVAKMRAAGFQNYKFHTYTIKEINTAMCHTEEYGQGGQYRNRTFGKVYVNGVDVTRNNPDAVAAILAAFNDRKYVQDYLKSGNDVHITQSLDGSISFSGIPLDTSLKGRKQDREKEEVAIILFEVARKQNPREPGKNIARLGKYIYLQYQWINKGIPGKEQGILLAGDDNFAALNRLNNIYTLYKNIYLYDEIEGFDTLGNDKQLVKSYLETYFIKADKSGIRDELLNALKDGASYSLYEKYKGIFESIRIKCIK